jgi:hypothetical protein
LELVIVDRFGKEAPPLNLYELSVALHNIGGNDIKPFSDKPSSILVADLLCPPSESPS